MRVFLPVGGFFAFLSILFSAIAMHKLVHSMPASDVYYFMTAARFEFAHSLALLAIGLFGFIATKPFKLLQISGYLMIVGIVFFCCDFYISTVFNVHSLLKLVPIGGIAFMLAWLVIFVAGIYYYYHSVHAHDL